MLGRVAGFFRTLPSTSLSDWVFFRVKTLRDQKVQESSKKVVFYSRNVVETWYKLKVLELSVFACFRRVFTLRYFVSSAWNFGCIVVRVVDG